MTAQIPLNLTLKLSRYVHEIEKTMSAVRILNLACVCSQAPRDAALVAHELRTLARQAQAAAGAFEECAKVRSDD